MIDHKKKGLLLVISGFSGAGKGTVMKRLLELHDEYALSVSATTRKPREGEQDGREYFFKSREEFEKMISDGALIEYAQYVNNYYGTPKDYVQQQLDSGKNVVLEIEIQGACNIKRLFKDAVLMFVMPPDAKELERRLRGRGTEDESTIRARLSRACEEAVGIDNYDYIVINDEVDLCVERIHSIVGVCCKEVMPNHELPEQIHDCEKMKTANNIELVNHIREELKAYSKGE